MRGAAESACAESRSRVSNAAFLWLAVRQMSTRRFYPRSKARMTRDETAPVRAGRGASAAARNLSDARVHRARPDHGDGPGHGRRLDALRLERVAVQRLPAPHDREE